MKDCPKCGGTGKVPDDRRIGREMRARREAAGLSQRKLGLIIGKSGPYLHDLEHGNRRWTLEMLAAYEQNTPEVE